MMMMMIDKQIDRQTGDRWIHIIGMEDDIHAWTRRHTCVYTHVCM